MVVFDGRRLAAEIESSLKERVAKMARKPRLAIVLRGEDPASVKYVKMKKRVAARVGIEVKVFEKLVEVDQDDFDGVMVQLPSDEDLSQIRPEKDVDGLNPDSKFVPATVKAVERILRMSDLGSQVSVAIVGSKGVVGTSLMRRFQISYPKGTDPMVADLRFKKITGFDLGDDLNKLKDFDVVISATGSPGLIKPEMVKEGVVCVDVGYPKGNFDPAVREKVSFWTPVPGGVGPVTVVCLLESVVEAAEKNL